MEQKDRQLPHPGEGNAFVSFCACAAAALSALSFLILFLLSLFNTCAIDPANYFGEHILFARDNLLVNLAVLSALFFAFALLGRSKAASGLFRRGALFPCLCLAVIFALGLLWTFCAGPAPAGDSKALVDAAREFLRGDYSALTSADGRFGAYYRFYPYQLGVTGYFALLQQLLGEKAYTSMSLVNLGFLLLGYGSILFICYRAFADRRVLALTGLMLLLYPQGILLGSFLYGNVPAFGLSLLGGALAVEYTHGGRWGFAVCAALALSAALVLKPNALIPAIAISLLLLLTGLSKKKTSALLLGALCLVLPILCARGTVAAFERRAGADLGEGAPFSLWLCIGLSESDKAPGWHSWIIDPYVPETRSELQRRVAPLLAERKAALSDPAKGLEFFTKKLQSQWDEPTFESVWVSRAGKTAPASALEAALWRGEAGGWYYQTTKFLVPFFYACFTGGLIWMLLKDRARFFGANVNLAALLLPLIALGAFLYHLLFEAKSQFAALYLPMLFPTASYFLIALPLGRRAEGDKARKGA